jgi:hypothetical protein
LQYSHHDDPGNISNISSANDDRSYETIEFFLKFLSNHLQEISSNQNQLQALNKSLKSAYKYMQDVEQISTSNEIPRTWTDLNENTMYL